MFKTLKRRHIKDLTNSDLGINALKLIEVVKAISDGKLVDIGVAKAKSSMILLNNSIKMNNKVWGIDPRDCGNKEILDHPNYTHIKDDSVKTGREWANGKVDLVFVDSVHIKPQVMRELYYWWDLVKVGGWLVFHDTNWNWIDENGVEQHYVNKSYHNNAGKRPGSMSRGCDTYAGIDWPTPDYAVKEFFGINSLTADTPYFTSEHCPENLGMTFLQKKEDHDFKSKITDWEKIELDRQTVLKYFVS